MLGIFPWFRHCLVVSGQLGSSRFSILLFSPLFCIFFALLTFSFLYFPYFFLFSFSFSSFVCFALTFLPSSPLYLSMPLLINSLNFSLPSTPVVPWIAACMEPQRLTARCGWNKHPSRRELNSASLVVYSVALFLPWLRYLTLRGGS